MGQKASGGGSSTRGQSTVEIGGEVELEEGDIRLGEHRSGGTVICTETWRANSYVDRAGQAAGVAGGTSREALPQTKSCG